MKDIKKKNPDSKVIVCWDGGKAKRREIFSDYKKRKTQVNYEIIEEAIEIEENLEKFEVYSLREKNYEADDLIATLSLFYKNKCPVTIWSSDQDFLQLIDHNISVFNGKKNITEKNFKKIFNLSPSQFLLKKIIVGDISDTIPGVQGIGEKTFFKLLEEYGSTENILKSPKIRKHLDIIERNFKLIKLGSIENFDFTRTEKELFSKQNEIRKWFFEIGFNRALADFGNFIDPFKLRIRNNV